MAMLYNSEALFGLSTTACAYICQDGESLEVNFSFLFTLHTRPVIVAHECEHQRLVLMCTCERGSAARKRGHPAGGWSRAGYLGSMQAYLQRQPKVRRLTPLCFCRPRAQLVHLFPGSTHTQSNSSQQKRAQPRITPVPPPRSHWHSTRTQLPGPTARRIGITMPIAYLFPQSWNGVWRREKACPEGRVCGTCDGVATSKCTPGA